MNSRELDCSPSTLNFGWAAVSRTLAERVVEKSGNHLSFAGTQLGNGREKSRDALAQSPELQSTMRQAIFASGPVRPGRREAAA